MAVKLMLLAISLIHSDSVSGDATGTNYTTYLDSNCLTGHGAINIDTSGTASPPRVMGNATECKSWCTDTVCCDCVVWHRPSKTCWRRMDCHPSGFQKAPQGDYTVFMKNTPAPPCPSPPPPPPTRPPVPYHPPPPVPPAKGGRNVLYIVFDDLRPDLSAYDVGFMKTPNIKKLAESGTLFERAYCQEAVCSPSRNSFSTGRRPNSTKVWNFINHFRNAECSTRNANQAVGSIMPGGWKGDPPSINNAWTQTRTGGFAQCCSSCSATPGCVGWNYNRNNCTLMSHITGWTPCANGQPKESAETCVGGLKGTFPQWTSLPGNFLKNGYLSLGVGKYFHPGGHSMGGAPGDSVHPAGPGTPPLADRYESWTPAGVNGTIQFPDQRIYAQKWGAVPSLFGNFEYLNPDDENCGSPFCHPNFEMDGTPPMPPLKGQMPLADFVTYNDAITKMQFAAENRHNTGQPFFLVTGIKRPHLNWRSPVGYATLHPVDNVSVPTQLTLDKSINPVAYTVFPMRVPPGKNFVTSPYVHGTDTELRELRAAYYAAVEWADTATGKILDELDRLNLTDDTMVVLHSDHGWHLGEYGMWEKRTNWELATRVPLIIRTPWIAASIGQRSKALVELVDVYKTVCDIIGISLPNDTVAIDGESLRPILEAPEIAKVKDVALSSFPRCAHSGMPIYGARGNNGWDNSCLEVERTDFTWMGYTMRTDRYRYTEWVRWNGSSLSPIWSDLEASELYDHINDTGAWTNPDQFENVNLVSSTDKSVVSMLSKQLHSVFGFPDVDTPMD